MRLEELMERTKKYYVKTSIKVPQLRVTKGDSNEQL